MTRNDPDRLDELLRASRALPRELEPPPDTWAGIRARLHTPRRARRGSRTSWLAAAAAVVLLAGSAVVVPRLGGTGGVAKGRGVQVATPMSSVSAAAAVEQRYAPAISELAAAVRAEQGRFTPGTVRVVTQSLADIDTAIAEMHDALRADPANPALADILSSHYERKVDLLQRAAELTTSF